MNANLNKINYSLCILMMLSIISCKKSIKNLRSDDDKESHYVITNYEDSILISLIRSKDKYTYHTRALIKKEGNYWYLNDKNKKDENGFIPLSDKIFPSFIFLSKNKNGILLEDEKSLLNDSILTYQKDGKYVTERKANEKPVTYFYYYDDKFNIDSIVLIKLNDTIIYK